MKKIIYWVSGIMLILSFLSIITSLFFMIWDTSPILGLKICLSSVIIFFVSGLIIKTSED